MGLFWIRPFDYINLDSCNRTAFYENRMIPPNDTLIQPLIKKPPSGEDYFKILDICNSEFSSNNNLNFPVLSHKAWKEDIARLIFAIVDENSGMVEYKTIEFEGDLEVVFESLEQILPEVVAFKITDKNGNVRTLNAKAEYID